MKSTKELISAPRVLRVEFSNLVSPESLGVLHTSGLTDDVPQRLIDLIQKAGGEKIKSVYKMSLDEIFSDKYGFAREFKVYLNTSANIEEAIKVLSGSHLVKSVKPIALRRSH